MGKPDEFNFPQLASPQGPNLEEAEIPELPSAELPCIPELGNKKKPSQFSSGNFLAKLKKTTAIQE